MSGRERCEPSDGRGLYHWLYSEPSGAVILQWDSERQRWNWRNFTPENMANVGYRYIAPCEPPEAVAELRVSNARLREALDEALSYIREETPEGCTFDQARDDTLERIRLALNEPQLG